jgi:hypothetical protein
LHLVTKPVIPGLGWRGWQEADFAFLLCAWLSCLICASRSKIHLLLRHFCVL